MNASISDFPETVSPTADEALIAQECCRRLSRFTNATSADLPQFRIQPAGAPEESVAIPASALRLLNDILIQMAKGNGVTLIPVDAELNTQQAADLINVSRAFLVEQLEQGAIPSQKVGTQRRVLFQDVMAYKQRMDQNRLRALEELSAQAQELGMGY